MDNYLVHGTQHRFVENIVKKGLNNKHSAVFHINQRHKYANLRFTLSIALYHAISIQAQDKIIRQGYINFGSFYKKNIDRLPSIIYYGDLIKNLDSGIQKVYKKLYTQEDIYSYPYYKVGNFGSLKEIKNIINIDLKDVFLVEDLINKKLEEDTTRFFGNVGGSIDGAIQDKNLKNVKLISKNYMAEICTRLGDQLLNRQ